MRYSRRFRRFVRTRFLILALIVGIFLLSLSEPIAYLFYHGLTPPCSSAPQVTVKENVLLVGDLHVRRSDSSKRFEGLRTFILKHNVSVLVIVGDLFDSPSDFSSLVKDLGGKEAVMKWLLGVLGVDGLDLDIYYVIGSISHDPQFPNLNYTFRGTSFQSVGKCLKLRVYGFNLVVLHGDAVVSGPVGFIITRLTGVPVFERLFKLCVGLSEDEWVVMAHTHVPLIDHGWRVANTGGWVRTPLQTPTGMGVLITKHGVKLVKVAEGSTSK